MTHFKINSETCISFSGGRTSAYMLWRVLEANDGLPTDAVVAFANTGKEDEATLEFVRECERQWSVPITWLEFRDNEKGYEIVNFETASRHGEPFEALIEKKNYLPNPVTRFCTIELKIRPMARWLLDLGMAETKSEAENMSWVGIRADEPRRAAKIADKSRIPLYFAGVTKSEVGDFWSKQTFDLNLPNINGVTYHGNCDLCFLKGMSQTLSLISERPERAKWWAKMEEKTLASRPDGAKFRKDRPSYSEMATFSKDQSSLFSQHTESIDCYCGE